MQPADTFTNKLRAYCRAKSGVDEELTVIDAKFPMYKDLSGFHYKILNGFSWEFAKFFLHRRVVLLRCDNDQLEELQAIYPGIQISAWMKWKTVGWKWVDVPLDSSIPEAILTQLLDRSYQIVYDELSDTDKQYIALSTQTLSIPEYLQKLAEIHDLSHRLPEIESFVKSAILLRTHRTDDAQLALGISKIGGLPDLPPGSTWPLIEGLPLGFLAQINLSEIPVLLHDGVLPTSGILYFFSVSAWRYGDGDWPSEMPSWESWVGGTNWSQVIYFTGDPQTLHREPKPDDVDMRVFPTGRVTFEAVPSLPRLGEDERDPVFRSLDWPEEECERFDDLYFEFSRILHKSKHYSAEHQMLDYASPIQYTPLRPDEMLLLQIDSDSKLDVMWGDGGTIYFMITEEALRRGDFSGVSVDFQSG